MSAHRTSAASQSLTTEFSSPPTYWMGLRTSGSSGSSRGYTDSPPIPTAYRRGWQPPSRRRRAAGLPAERATGLPEERAADARPGRGPGGEPVRADLLAAGLAGAIAAV